MGMFDSFYLKAKCPYCGNEEVIEFQTKEFANMLDVWEEGDDFTGMNITDGVIEGVYGCCRVKNNPECGDMWEKEYHKGFRGFGRMFYCDVKITDGKVDKAINIRSREDEDKNE